MTILDEYHDYTVQYKKKFGDKTIVLVSVVHFLNYTELIAKKKNMDVIILLKLLNY